MGTELYEALPEHRQADVRAAVCAVETARWPVPASSLRALAEVPLRRVVEEMLAATGRVLLAVGDGFVSGYDDAIRTRLAGEGVGVLGREDRAVLTLVFLFSVAIPRARGGILGQTLWTEGVPVSRDRLKDSAVADGAVDDALARLATADLVRFKGAGVVLGPQVLRLTEASQAALLEQLVLLAEPGGALAESILRLRARRDALGSQSSSEE
ncbi:hypothetical protein AB0N46_13605 [Streptomyces albidoflavus]|uniref:hypothetical protein n=1 Tax=Streptomyces TaxID=1883 RepID=UPI003415DE65